MGNANRLITNMPLETWLRLKGYAGANGLTIPQAIDQLLNIAKQPK